MIDVWFHYSCHKQNLLEKKFPGDESLLNQYKKNAEEFICNCIHKGNNNIKKTNGGLLWWQPWNNLQYVTAATFVITSYADTLFATKNSLQCATGTVESSNLIMFVKSQVRIYINLLPQGTSIKTHGTYNDFTVCVWHDGIHFSWKIFFGKLLEKIFLRKYFLVFD